MTIPSRVQYFAADRNRYVQAASNIVVVASAANVTLDATEGLIQTIQLEENVTIDDLLVVGLTPGLEDDGVVTTLIIRQDVTGSWTLTFDSGFKKESGASIAVASGTLETTVYQIYTSTFLGNLVVRVALNVVGV